MNRKKCLTPFVRSTRRAGSRQKGADTLFPPIPGQYSPSGRVLLSGLERGFSLRIFVSLFILIFPNLSSGEEPASPTPHHILFVVGASGSSEFGEQFENWASMWQTIAKDSSATFESIGRDDHAETLDRDLVKSSIERASGVSDSPLWIVLIGHGTFTRGVAKFNLRGPDVSAAEFAQWLVPVKRPLVIVNCTSSSGPFINRLSGDGRVVVTATKSGTEQSFARFGGDFVQAISSTEADLDHDDEVSVLEAFLLASAGVHTFYESESRIATEHALIDDNGDGKGTPASMFRAARPIGTAKDGSQLDGRLASQLILPLSKTRLTLTIAENLERNLIEKQLVKLRGLKSELSERVHDQRIEPLLIRLARIYGKAEERATLEHGDQ